MLQQLINKNVEEFQKCSILLSIQFTVVVSSINPLSANPTNWSNTLKQFVKQNADELFDCVWPFCEVGALKG